MSLSDAENKANAQAWEREHGAAFIRSVYSGGIPREMLASFGIWIEEPKAPPASPEPRQRVLLRRKGQHARKAKGAPD